MPRTRGRIRTAWRIAAQERRAAQATLLVSTSDSDSDSDSSLFSRDEEDDEFDTHAHDTHAQESEDSGEQDEEKEAYALLHKQAGAQPLTEAEQARVRELRDKYGFDRWQIMKDYTIYLPLHTIHTDEYEAFARKFLPNTIAGHTRSQVMNQANGTEHKYYYKNVRIAPPIFRNGAKGQMIDSFGQAFRRKSTLACVVLADVYHETREYRDCLTLEDVYTLFNRNVQLNGWRAVKGKVVNGKLTGQTAPTACPPVNLPKATAEKFAGKGIVIILPFPRIRKWGTAWKFNADDVFAQKTRKPFPEYDQRLLLDKTLVINAQVPLFDLPLLMGAFAGVPHFCTAEEERSPVTASFVINGLPKSIFMQFRLIPNVCFVFKVTGNDSAKYRYNCEIRSLRDTTKWNSTSTLFVYLLANSDRIVLHVPSFSTRNNSTLLDVPLLDALLMLGITSSAQIREYLYPPHIDVSTTQRDFLNGVLSELDWSTTVESVRAFYSSKLGKTAESVQSTFNYMFLSHCDYGDVESNESKLYFFAASLRKLSAVALGELEEDDRDHVANKQVQGSGQLVATLNRQLWRNYVVEQNSGLTNAMQQQKIIDVHSMLSARSKPTARIMTHFHSGQWSVYSNSRQGYLQIKCDTNDLGCYEQLSRVSKPIKRDVKSKTPRFMPPSGVRKLCVSATPDGAPTGLVNNIAVNCRLSGGVDVDLVAKIVHGFGFFDERAASLQPQSVQTESTATATTLKQAATGLSESRGSGAQMRSLVRGPTKAKPLKKGEKPYHHTVYINGNAVGCLKPDVHVQQFIDTFRRYRRKRVVPRDASIHFDQSMHGIQIHCEIGRMMTAVLIVSEMERVPAVMNMCRQTASNTVKELFIQGCVEFVDAFEEEHAVVALDPNDVYKGDIKYDYCAFSATTVFGMSAAMIPSAHRNAAPRVSYHSAGQMKSALQETKDIDNPRFLAPTVVMPICNAQFPIFTTKNEKCMRTPETCATGYNPYVVVLTEGYNQEDSVVGNQCAFDRGFQQREEYVQVTVRTTINKTTLYMKPPKDASHRKMSIKSKSHGDHRAGVGRVFRVKRRGALDDGGDGQPLDPFDYIDFEKTLHSQQQQHDCFHAIQRNGFPKKNTIIEPGDVILGRVNKVYAMDENGKQTVKFVCASVTSSKRGVVTDIIQNTNRECHVVVFRLYTVHSPTVGDKITSRSGQKGTIGRIRRSRDLPFSRDGIIPEIIMNPHAFPSRMTVAHLLESMASKVAMMLGLPTIDGTSFTDDITLEIVAQALDEHGYAPGGEEEFYCGETGRRFRGQLFSGLVFYKVLRHLAAKKAHARASRGPSVLDTQQPTGGKKREGGLRFGEMDRDCLFAHGASQLYHNLTVFNSDPAVVWFCQGCGQLANSPAESDNWATHRCSNPNCRGDNVVYIHTTWSHLLLLHKLQAMNIKLTYDVIQSLTSNLGVRNPQNDIVESDSDSGSEEEAEEEEAERKDGKDFFGSKSAAHVAAGSQSEQEQWEQEQSEGMAVDDL